MKISSFGLRWLIVSLLSMASALNYFDRQALSVLAQTLQNELHLTTADYANITSAFLLSYTIMYAVSGRLVDLLGTRRSFLIFVSGWSLASVSHIFARTALQFSFVRFLLGATEAANFPAGVKAVSEWFPMRERPLAIGIFNSGVAVGAAIAAPIISWLALTWGWRSAFVFGGALGGLWIILWAIIYQVPRRQPWISHEELRLIESSDTAEEEGESISLRRLLRNRAVWGCIVSRMLLDPCSYFYTFWVIKYLQQERGFDLAAVGKFSWIPFAALALGNVYGGLLPGQLIARGWTHNRARKAIMLGCSVVIPISCLLTTKVPTAALAIGTISVSMFCHGAWGFMSLPAELFPKRVVGSVTGIAGTVGGVTAIVTQQIIGWTVENVSYAPAFAACAFAYLMAFAVVCLFAGKVGQVRNPT